VVLLHGQPGTSADWDEVGADLSRDHLVIAPDRLGYGSTGGRAGGFSANANAIVRLLRSLGLPGAVIVGHSWGGAVALQLAVDFPKMVQGLGLVASVAPGDRPSAVDRLLARPVAGTALAALTLSTAGSFLAWGPGRALAGHRLRGQAAQGLDEVARAWRRPATWGSFAIEQRALVHELPGLAGRLGSIGAPTVVITGTADRVVLPAAGRRLAAAIPGASLQEVPGAGHLLPQLWPGLVAGAVRRLRPS
jgi:pimeloyl-ACP methyl ester carboxylesterase